MHVRSLVSFIWRWWYVLLLGPILGGGAGYVVVQRVPGVYQASEIIAVQPVTAAGGVADMQAGQALADSYAEQIHAHPVLARAAVEAGLDGLPATELDNTVQARRIVNTALLRISAQNQDPGAATRLVNAVVQVFISQTTQDEVSRYTSTQENLVSLITQLQNDIDARNQQLVGLRAAPTSPENDAQINRLQDQVTRLQLSQDVATRTLQDVQLAEARRTSALSVVDPAVALPDPIRPNRPLLLLIAVLAGALAGVGLALLGEHYDDRLRDPGQVLTALQLPTLSLVPEGRSGLSPGAPTDQNVLASFRQLRTNLLIAVGDRTAPVVAIASSRTGDPKSVVAANLATALAHTGRKVILVDADFDQPSQPAIFGVDDGPGLASLLMNDSTPVLQVLSGTRISNLQLLPSGASLTASADLSALLSSTRLESVLQQLREAGDVVIVDAPAVVAHPESALLSSHADFVVFVVDARHSRARDSQSALALLRNAGSTVLGVVLTGARRNALLVVHTPLNSAGLPATPPAGDFAQSRSIFPVGDG